MNNADLLEYVRKGGPNRTAKKQDERLMRRQNMGPGNAALVASLKAGDYYPSL
jgi:hypothetical protein